MGRLATIKPPQLCKLGVLIDGDFTDEEREELDELFATGMGNESIAEAINKAYELNGPDTMGKEVIRGHRNQKCRCHRNG